MMQLETFHKVYNWPWIQDLNHKICKQEIMNHDVMYMQQISKQGNRCSSR